MVKKLSRRIYLDHAATTPVDAGVLRAMTPYFSRDFYNPSALYSEGVAMSNLLSAARASVAKEISALADEIVFTGSGTEADNLAILGVVKASLPFVKKPHIIISAIEHPAILELGKEVKKLGGSVTVVPVDEKGIVDLSVIRNAIGKNTVLVSVMAANNEVGTIQPLTEVAKIIREYKKTRQKFSKKNVGGQEYPYFHTDASQAINYCTLNVLELHTDLLTLDGSKIYGPKGVGILFVKRRTVIDPIIIGGGQEKGLRSGTESLPHIVGFAKALEITRSVREKETKRLTALRDFAIAEILKKIPGSTLNGDSEKRLANNINICFPGIDAEYAVILLDSKGFAVSTASSCRTLTENVRSYVVEAMRGSECAQASIRITLGRSTTRQDVQMFLKVLPDVVQRATQTFSS